MKRNFEIPENGGEKNEKPRGISRREFLKRGGSAAALVLLPFGAGLFAETRRASSAEIQNGDSWTEGLRALKDEVFTSETESGALFVKHNHDEGMWQEFSRGSESGIFVSQDMISLWASTPDVENVQIAHTHPLKVFENTHLSRLQIVKNKTENIREESMPLPSVPPSRDDILGTIMLYASLEAVEPQKKVSEIVVDPRGVWKFAPDLAERFPQKHVLYQAKKFKNLVAITEDGQILEILKEHEYISDAETLLKHLQEKEWNRISSDMRALVKETVVDMERFEKTMQPLDEIILQFMKKSLEAEKPDDISALFQVYKKFGIHLSFTSYKDLGIE